MSSTMSNGDRSDLVRSTDFPRPTPAKADLRESDHRTASDHIGLTVGEVVKLAVVKHYGSVKAAAFALGEGARQPRLDPSLMMREFEAGKLARLDLDPKAKGCVATALHVEFGAPESRSAKAYRLLREVCIVLKELETVIQEVA